ncbi:MAG: FecR family protein [Thermoanaerobaculales bacterium]|jgi:hypothetical protein|nr:FecR family protein [Thermoanaerobaculales bacterium]
MKTLRTAALILMAVAPLAASAEDDPTSLSYISYLERYATIQPASDDDNIEAVANMPLVIGDRVDTAREARMEIILADGSVLWLDQYTTVSLDAVAFSRDVGGDRTVLYLVDGRAMVQVPQHVLSSEPLRVDSADATVYLNQPGLYRLEVLRSGGLRLEVWEGLGEAATVAGGMLVQPSTAAEVRSGEVSGVEPHLTWGDDFARWVEQRRSAYGSESSQYVDERYARESAILDSYGTWVYVDASQSWAWQPAVGPDWRPYTAGRWYWTATGWSWVSYEPWGWLPYHYGSWTYAAGYGWVWGWGSVWSPAWVSWCWWPGYVSWCPWGYYNSWCWGRYPGWGWGHYPSYPSNPPGGGHPRPPRGDVVPPRDGVAPADGGRREPPDARLRAGAAESGSVRRVTPGEPGTATSSSRRAAADFTGHVRVAEMDRAGWNVVAAEDFASEHLARVVQPGSRVMPTDGNARGVVVTGPLTTRSPSRAISADEISRTFADVGARTDRDITRVMARDSSLQREDIDRLVQPISLNSLGRSSAQSVVASRTEASAPSRSSAGGGGPELSSSSSSPFAVSASPRSSVDRLSTPNYYRPGRAAPGLSGGSRTLVGSGSGSTSSGAVAPSSGAPAGSGRSLPRAGGSSTLPTTRSSSSLPSTRSTVTLPRTRSTSSLPSARSSSSPFVRQPVSPRAGGGRSSSLTGSSRPVIIPRTSPTRPSRSLGSGSSPSRSFSLRRAPARGSSTPSVRAPSGSSGGRSSSSARPSSGSSSKSSRSAASSGGAKSRRR